MKKQNLIIFILTIGVFSILNTELGIIGILPLIADRFQVSVSQGGLMVSLFALTVAISGPTMPLLLSRVNRKKVMLIVLGVFTVANFISIFASNFTIALIARVVPAVFHPVFISLALTLAASSVSKEEAPKAVSKVFVGVSAGVVIGVPVASFIASSISVQMAMLYFTTVSAIAFIATVLFVPSMPVTEVLSYGAQLGVLRKSVVWLSMVAVVFLNGAVIGVYSYLTEFLEKVTSVSWNTISMMLVIYGVANIIGNIVAGTLLTKNANKSLTYFPIALGAVYIILFLSGQFTLPMALIILAWGILAGAGGVFNQYWVSSAASDAPDFANGLFLASANLGTTMGTTVCGFFIAGLGTRYMVLGGLLLLTLSIFSILLRVYMVNHTKRTSKQVI